VLSGGSRACLARFDDKEPSLGGVGVLLCCSSGGGASLPRKLRRVEHRYRGQRCSRDRCRRQENLQPPTPEHFVDRLQCDVAATAWLHAREASGTMCDSLSGRFGCSDVHVLLCAPFLYVVEWFLALPLAQELVSFLETIHEVPRVRIIHFHRHSERRKPRATTTTYNDVPSRGM